MRKIQESEMKGDLSWIRRLRWQEQDMNSLAFDGSHFSSILHVCDTQADYLMLHLHARANNNNEDSLAA